MKKRKKKTLQTSASSSFCWENSCFVYADNGLNDFCACTLCVYVCLSAEWSAQAKMLHQKKENRN